MKEVIKIISVLTFVCLLCAFSLALVQGSAEEKIKSNAAQRIKEAITNLAPNSQVIEELFFEQDTVYELKNERNTLIGYAFSAQGQGYQGQIKILAVVNPSLSRLEGIEVVDSLETPGLGAKIQDEPFSSQFKGLNLGESIESVKDAATEAHSNSQIEAITGATVSSRAVVNILNERIETLKEQISHFRSGK